MYVYNGWKLISPKKIVSRDAADYRCRWLIFLYDRLNSRLSEYILTRF